MGYVLEAVGRLIIEESLHFGGVRDAGIMELIEDRCNRVVPLQLIEVRVGLHLESRKTVGYRSAQFGNIPSGATSCEGIEDTSDNAHRHLGGLRLLLRGDVGDIVDEDVGVMQQLFAGIAQHDQSAGRLERQGHIDIVGVILSARLDELGVECSVCYRVTAETEPDSNHSLRHLVVVEQLLRMQGVRFQLGCREGMSVRRFVVAGVTALHTPDEAVVDHTHVTYRVVVVLIGDGKRVKRFVDLAAELIFRVIHQHRRKRVAAILHITLCLYGKHRTDTKDG